MVKNHDFIVLSHSSTDDSSAYSPGVVADSCGYHCGGNISQIQVIITSPPQPCAGDTVIKLPS